MTMKFLQRLNERGDTLVEVTIALAILSLILVSAFVTANRSFAQGQTSKERSELASVAQEQADALKSFRDSHTWTQFACGSTGCNEPGPAQCDQQNGSGVYINYCGIRIGTFNKCNGDPRNECFHMELHTVKERSGVVTEWIPVIEAQRGLVGGGYVYFNLGIPAPGNLGETGGSVNAAQDNFYFDFYEGYGNVAIGSALGAGYVTQGSYWLRLSDLEGFR